MQSFVRLQSVVNIQPYTSDLYLVKNCTYVIEEPAGRVKFVSWT